MIYKSCRYCPLFVSDLFPVSGYCIARPIPRRVEDVNSAGLCPYDRDKDEVSRQAFNRGLYGKDVSRLEYYGVSEYGIRTRSSPSLDRILESVKASGIRHTIYVEYIDPDNRIISRAVIPPSVPS